MVTYFPPETKWNLEYDTETVNWYIKTYKAELLGWLYTTENNYYTIPLKNEKASVTPLMLFKRKLSETSHFAFENEMVFTCTRLPNNKYNIVQTNVEEFKDVCEKYPWIIMTEGCDDGHIGWRFETKDLAKRWVYYLSITNFQDKDYDSFLDLFKTNRGWLN